MTWPLTRTDLRAALGYLTTDGDNTELDLFIAAACEAVDKKTGRDVTPTRHNLVSGDPPLIFKLAARETAKLWWQQSKNGPRGGPQGADAGGPPMGAALPRKVEGWLEGYPAAPAIA
jgi:hypothetical protein